MLPKSNGGENIKPAKYADTGIPLLIEKMVEAGARRENMTAKISRGSTYVFQFGRYGYPDWKRNIEAVYRILEEYNIPIIGEDLEKIMAGPWNFIQRTAGSKSDPIKKGRNLYKIN